MGLRSSRRPIPGACRLTAWAGATRGFVNAQGLTPTEFPRTGEHKEAKKSTPTDRKSGSFPGRTPVRTAGEAVSRSYRRCRRQYLASAAVSAGPATVNSAWPTRSGQAEPSGPFATQGKDRARTGRSELFTAHRTCPRTAAQSRQRGITSGGQDAPVTLSYLKSVISLRKLRHLVPYIGLGWTAQGFLRAPQKPHNSATRRPVPTGIPQTKRHTLNRTGVSGDSVF
jgi:hypothetical protein